MARNVVTQVDSADFFVQHRDSTALVLNPGTTAGGTNNSADQATTLHKGVALYVAIASMTVNTATLAVNINGKNAVDGLYYPVARCSLDGLTNGSGGNFGIEIYPGMVSNDIASNVPPAFAQRQGVTPAVFQVQASLTVTTTASMTGTLSYKIGMSKLV